MKEQYFLAVDLGASSGRHILGHLSQGKLEIEEIYRFKNSLCEKDGHLTWDVDRLYAEILEGLALAGRLHKAPSYIGIDTWGVDYVLLDKKDRRLGEAYGYRDSRTRRAVEEVHKIVPFAALYAKTGIQFQPFNTIYQLYADKESGKLADAASLLMLPDYFSFLLTGVKKQEYTNATTTGLINASTHRYDEQILSALGLPSEIFSSVSQPGTRLGPLRKEVSKRLGYEAEVVLPCTHDTASAVMALPSFEKAPYISSGTWSLLGIESDRPYLDEASRAANFTNEGAPSFRFRYQKNIMGLWIMQRLKEETEDLYDFAELSDLARNSKTALTIDVNDNRFLTPRSMIEEVRQAAGASLNIGEIAYCVLHSLALSYAASLTEIEKATGQKYSALHIIGGGSQNHYLNVLTAKEAQVKVIAGPTESTAIGNLVYVMRGAGIIKDDRALKQLIVDSFATKEVIP
jgi:rhamnulokinase